jgi:hypothetical protein
MYTYVVYAHTQNYYCGYLSLHKPNFYKKDVWATRESRDCAVTKLNTERNIVFNETNRFLLHRDVRERSVAVTRCNLLIKDHKNN